MATNPSLVHAIESVVERFPPHATASDAHRQQLSVALQDVIKDAPADDLYEAAERLNERPDVAVLLLEAVVQAQPNNARALVRLANGYWLLGAGPQPVGELAARAIAADPADRAAWHLWALAEERPRERVKRWQQVAARFPQDNLALANVADNAASVAGAERDYEMVDLAISAFEELKTRSQREEERAAVDHALTTLRQWRF